MSVVGKCSKCLNPQEIHQESSKINQKPRFYEEGKEGFKDKPWEFVGEGKMKEMKRKVGDPFLILCLL